MDKFLNFCANTSLHGWRFFNRESSGGRLAWLVVMLTSISSAIYMVTFHAIHFYHATVSFQLRALTEPLDEVFFPSAVICNSNALRQSFISELMLDPGLQNYTRQEIFNVIEKTFIRGTEADEADDRLIHEILESETYDKLLQQFLKDNYKDHISPSDGDRHINTNTDLYLWHDVQMTINITEENEEDIKIALMNEIATQFREGEMMPSVEFSGWGVFYETGFSTDLSETCTWITPYVRESEEPTEIRYSQPYCKMGTNNGLRILLDAETFDYASTPILSTDGFTISILHGLDIPIMKQTGISVGPGQSVQIAVTPTLMSTTDAAKRRFAPIDRTCYFEDEISLRHFPIDHDYRYEMSNCIFEATLQQIEKTCKCTPKNFIDVIDDYDVCTGEAKECMNFHMQNMGDFRIINDEGVDKPCLAACHDQTFEVLVSQSGYPNENTFRRSDHYCMLVKKLLESCSNTKRIHIEEKYPKLCQLVARYKTNSSNSTVTCTFESQNQTDDDLSHVEGLLTSYARDNLAFVTVFIPHPYVAHYRRDETISEISFASNIGGLLGLFLGFSVISIVEVVYLGMQVNMRKGKEKNKTKVEPVVTTISPPTPTPVGVVKKKGWFHGLH